MSNFFLDTLLKPRYNSFIKTEGVNRPIESLEGRALPYESAPGIPLSYERANAQAALD